MSLDFFIDKGESKFTDWQFRKDRQYCRNEIGEDTFEIYFQPRDYVSLSGYRYLIMNIGFDKLINKKPAEKFELTKEQIAEIYRGIIGRVNEYDIKHHYDAVTCLAFDNHFEREKVYSNIGEPISKFRNIRLGTHSCTIKCYIDYGVDAYVNCTRELAREDRAHFKQYLSKLTMRWVPNWDNK